MGVYFSLFKQSLYQPVINRQYAITNWQKKIPRCGIFKKFISKYELNCLLSIAYYTSSRSEGVLPIVYVVFLYGGRGILKWELCFRCRVTGG
jgi:hypothetical protein